MMTTKSKDPKEPKEYKVPCDGLSKIISLKKLSEREVKQIIKKLKQVIKSSSPGNADILSYIQVLVTATLTVGEKESLVKYVRPLKGDNPEHKSILQQIMLSLYYSIINVYPGLEIHSVCADVNGILNLDQPAAMEDQAFQEHLKKETKKKEKKKAYEFSTNKDIEDLRIHLSKNLIGQDQAINVVCDTLKLKVAGFAKVVNLFFIGKTGRGKTELAKLLGDRFSGNFWLINCAEFANGHEVNRLLGAPPGYVGHSDKSLLKEKSEKSNKWVIVFDEIEKANPKFYNFLLSLMETGTCSDNIGTKVDFSESIFIFTSNCGLKDLKNKSTNFHFQKNASSDMEYLKDSLEEEFSPEFRNRIDEYVFFNDLTKEDARKIVDLRLKSLPLNRTPEIVNFVVENGFSEEFGARELNRFIKKKVALPLANVILDKRVPQDGTENYEAIVDNGQVKIVNTLSN